MEEGLFGEHKSPEIRELPEEFRMSYEGWAEKTGGEEAKIGAQWGEYSIIGMGIDDVILRKRKG